MDHPATQMRKSISIVQFDAGISVVVYDAVSEEGCVDAYHYEDIMAGDCDGVIHK